MLPLNDKIIIQVSAVFSLQLLELIKEQYFVHWDTSSF
jgi:hypothetical protein